MYAVIKTGGKQYRVQAGDLLVVEKLDGDVGAEVAFNDVLLVGEGADVIVGAPLVDGAVVNATLIETRKGDKVKIFKKIRRQGYRRTKGHRQHESVLRVTSVAGQGKESKWDGVVDLTPKAVLDARARNLKIEVPVAAAPAPVAEAPAKKAAPKKAAAKTEASAEAAPAKKAAPKAKAKPASDTEA
ncbi:MAG TPA: 50S ribosomal protein L21 [Caulobacteraceae bacterium]|nr:50S ribosomal protein L21 [Caulobacteraceae bacterium]